MTPEEGGVRDPSHQQGNTRVSLADTSLIRALIGSGGIQGGGAGVGVGEGGRAGTGSGGEQGVDTGEARGGRRVGVHSEDHGVEVGAGEEVGVMKSWTSLVGARISNSRKNSNLRTAGPTDQTINQ